MNADASPAERAAQASMVRVIECIDQQKSFRLEAGAGAGKTYSLVEALRYVIAKRGAELMRRHQNVACITYTNVASDEIKARTDAHPVILSTTIHAFCWAIIKDFQPLLRGQMANLPGWPDRLAEIGGIENRRIDYELGFPSAKKGEGHITVGHGDVVALAAKLISNAKFRMLLAARYPILFIDEYQDTSQEFAHSLAKHLLDPSSGILVGLFGDHWQKIYDDVCGRIDHANLVQVDKGANFRSASAIVNVLNRMRPELPQQFRNASSQGSVIVYHTNQWVGTRLSSSAWKGDLPQDAAHRYVSLTRQRLIAQGWDFSPQSTKVLMLTHAVLADEQGYSRIAEIFRGRSEQFAKKEHPYLQYLVDTVEPGFAAYENKRYGEMLGAFGLRAPSIESHADKAVWKAHMEKLRFARDNGTVGDVVAHLRHTGRPPLSEAVERAEETLSHPVPDEGADASSLDRRERTRQLRDVPYAEVAALTKFLNGQTPFATKHGVKGAEYDNVLVVIGRGWNKYDFNRMLELWGGPFESSQQQLYFEDSRNLFYVACSRPKSRLALLFTQKLSARALDTLAHFFGRPSIEGL